MENKNKIKDIKSFCKKYFKGFASVIANYETSKLDIDLLSLENIFVQSIDSIGRILSSSFFIKNNMYLNGKKQFGVKHFTCVQYISSILINIIDLPILFPKTARLAAIRQIGKIVSRVGWLKDAKYQRVVYTTAKNFQSRIQVTSNLTSNFTSDFDCAYLFALSHMAIDPQLQDILLKVIESYIPLLTSSSNSTTQDESSKNLNDIKISVCKAVQKLDQSTERLYKIMKSLAEDKTAHPEVSSEASLAFLCMSIKSNKRDTVKRITKGLNELILNSELSSDIKSAIKMLYNICSSYPDQKSELLPILIKFIKSNSAVHRDYALYILAKLEIELNHKEYVKEISEMVKNHFSKRMDSKTDSNNDVPLLKYVIKTASVICSNYIQYAVDLNETIDSLLNAFPFKNESTSSLFDVKIAFTTEEIQSAATKAETKKNKKKKRKQEAELKSENDNDNDSFDTLSNENEDIDEDADKNDSEKEKETANSPTTIDVLGNESDDDSSGSMDPFEGYEPLRRKISPNTIVVLAWRRELANSKLVVFKNTEPEIGYTMKTEWISPPKGFQIYEDVVAHFFICCNYPDKAESTLHPFFQRLADTRRQTGRNPVSWEQISNIMDNYCVLNYVQLFFALCFMQQQKQEGETSEYEEAKFEVVRDLLSEMNQVLDLVTKKEKEKVAKRTPQTELPQQQKQRPSRF